MSPRSAMCSPNSERASIARATAARGWEHPPSQRRRRCAIDLSMDRNNPRILFAVDLGARRNFWNISSGGPGSGLFRSTDGGDTWEEISHRPGLPDGLLGKIGVAVSPVRAGRVWALVEAEGDKTGLYRSDDYGMRWTTVSANRDLMHRPWYYTHVFADTGHADTVFRHQPADVESTDGGTSFSEITTRHGDNHDLWIDPNDCTRMIEGNDGGAHVSFNAGALVVDHLQSEDGAILPYRCRQPVSYRVYGTQQDNTSISVPSASEWGVITLADCSIRAPARAASSPSIRAITTSSDVGAIGSSPGGQGPAALRHRTRQLQLVNVWPEESTGIAPKDLKYRFAWTFPIVFSPHDPGHALCRRQLRVPHPRPGHELDADFARSQPQRSRTSRAIQAADHARARRRGARDLRLRRRITAPRRRDHMASTDDGLVHVTRDDGRPGRTSRPGACPSSLMSAASRFGARPDTIYVAATRYKLADYKPYLFRTSDGGGPGSRSTAICRRPRSPASCAPMWWRPACCSSAPRPASISRSTTARLDADAGLAGGAGVRSQAPGTATGGGDARPLVLDSRRRDRAARSGRRRSFDARDRAAQRPSAPSCIGCRRQRAHRIAYGPAFGIDGSTVMVERPDGTRVREHLDVGEKSAQRAIIYYWLAEDASGPVTLTFRDSAGPGSSPIRATTRTFRQPSTGHRAGSIRFVWDRSRAEDRLWLAPPRPSRWRPIQRTAGPGPSFQAPAWRRAGVGGRNGGEAWS